jgi:hypothetical protein
MLQSERDAERFYEAQRKFEQRQRMIDKGWGDMETHKQLEIERKKKERRESIRLIILGSLLGAAMSIFFFGANYLMHGYAI